MDGFALFVLLALLLGIGVPLALYAPVRRERENATRMRRAAGERAARRDATDRDGGRDRG